MEPYQRKSMPLLDLQGMIRNNLSKKILQNRKENIKNSFSSVQGLALIKN